MHCHQHEPNLHVTCGSEGCRDTFKNYSTFRRHYYRKHKKLSVSSASPEEQDKQPSAEEMELQYQDCSQDQLLSVKEMFPKRQLAMFC